MEESDTKMCQMQRTIRRARPGDVHCMVELSERKRLQYQKFQPIFWRKAENSREKQAPFFKHLVNSDNIIALVHERNGTINGFVIATLVSAPPVYNPGGFTCMIDDFVVDATKDWQTIGAELLSKASCEAKAGGAVQVVIACGHQDKPKRSMLASSGFSIASEWYVQEI